MSDLTCLVFRISELLSPSTGHAPGVGEIFRNPTIAQTLRDIGTGGKDAFYTGRVAQSIVDVVTANGGLLSLDDLAKHSSTWVDPISTTYGPVRCALLIFCYSESHLSGQIIGASYSIFIPVFGCVCCLLVGCVRVWEIPPNGQGLTALLALNLIKALDRLEGLPHNGPDYLHQLIEVLRYVSFEDTGGRLDGQHRASRQVAESMRN